MKKYRHWRISYLILAISSVHIAWSAILLFSAAPLNTTSMGGVPWNFNRFFASGFYFTIASLAMVGMLSHYISRKAWSVLFIIPQQAALIYSAYTVAERVNLSMYYDGVLRPMEFILADQIYVFIFAILHSFCLIDWHFFSASPPPNFYNKIILDSEAK